MSAFRQAAKDAGFSEEQARFLDTLLSKPGHHHDIEEVDGLEEELAALEGDEDEDDEDEED